MEGLDYATAVHVMWVPPFANGVPIDHYLLTVTEYVGVDLASSGIASKDETPRSVLRANARVENKRNATG